MFLKSIIAAAAVAGLAAAAGADTFDAAGTGQGSASSQAMPVADGLVVIHAVTDYTGFETADPDSPMATASGPCFGAVVVDGGRVSGGGDCVYTDADGDAWVTEWSADGIGDDGRTQGSWRIVGGTGKWDGATGGGRFDAGEDAAGAYTNNVTGAVSMP